MTGTFGRLIVNDIKQAFWNAANIFGVSISFQDGPHGLLSFTIPIKITWTGTEVSVDTITTWAKNYMSEKSVT